LWRLANGELGKLSHSSPLSPTINHNYTQEYRGIKTESTRILKKTVDQLGRPELRTGFRQHT